MMTLNLLGNYIQVVVTLQGEEGEGEEGAGVRGEEGLNKIARERKEGRTESEGLELIGEKEGELKNK